MQIFSATNVRNEIKELGCAFLGAFGLACSGIQIWEENQCACMHAFLLLDDSLKLPTSLSIFDAYIAESRNDKTWSQK